jgi:hypothetical protein
VLSQGSATDNHHLLPNLYLTIGCSTRKLRLRCCCVESAQHGSGERRQWTNDLRIIGYQQVRLCKAKELLLNTNQRIGAIDMSKAWTHSHNMSKVLRNLDPLEKHVQIIHMLYRKQFIQLDVQKQVLMIRGEESPYHPIFRSYTVCRKYSKILRETHHHSSPLRGLQLLEMRPRNSGMTGRGIPC